MGALNSGGKEKRHVEWNEMEWNRMERSRVEDENLEKGNPIYKNVPKLVARRRKSHNWMF